MTKDRLAIIFALLLQAGAITWWASKINYAVEDLSMHVDSCLKVEHRIEKLEWEMYGNKSK